MLSVISVNAYAKELPDMKVEINAKSAVLMEASTGEILMSKNAHERFIPHLSQR